MIYKDDEIEIDFSDEDFNDKVREAKLIVWQYNRATNNWFISYSDESDVPPLDTRIRLEEECLCRKVKMCGLLITLVLNNGYELQLYRGKDEDGSEYNTLHVTKKAENELNSWRQKTWLEHPNLSYNCWD